MVATTQHKEGVFIMTHQFTPGFSTLAEEITCDRLPIEGSMPGWPAGSLLRNGPAQFEVGQQKYRHWFDGHISKLGEHFVALTEAPLPIEFDPKTLETVGVIHYDDRVTGQHSTPGRGQLDHQFFGQEQL
jgi:carotenoid cleavage dioxygenase-like enzyme